MLNRRFSLTRRPLKAPHLLFIITLLPMVLGMPPAQSTRIDPVFKPVSPSAASATAWNALPNTGLDLRVRALAMVDSDLYVGGRFTQTGDGSVTNLNRIARYDTVAGTWNALPNQGLSDEVTALAVVGNDLYAGGWFTQTVDGAVLNLGNVAHYDTTTGTWNALPNQGLNDKVFALAVVGNDLYVGGIFGQTGDGSVTNLNRIARYDTVAGTWNALPNQGLNGPVFALAVAGNDLYVGGTFEQTGDGSGTNLNHIARYDTVAGTWNALPNQGLNGYVTALAVSSSNLYVGGVFTQTIDGAVLNLGNVAHCDTTTGTWNALPNQGLNGPVFALAAVGNDLYAGGAFGQTGDGSVTNLGYIARHDTTTITWSALPSQGLNSWVYVFAAVDSDLYVGGEFNQTGDGMGIGLGHIACFGICDYKVYLPLAIRQ